MDKGQDSTFNAESSNVPPPENGESLSERGSLRTRKLTDKGFHQYQEQLDKLYAKEDMSWSAIETIVTELDEKDREGKSFRKLKSSVQRLKHEFLSASYEIIQYLERTRSTESEDELAHFNECFKRKCSIISQLQHRIADILTQELAETVSCGGSTSSTARKKKMELEIQKTKLEFVKEKVKLEGQMEILKQSEMVAVAEAEARVLEETEMSASCRLSLQNVEHMSSKEQVENYLKNLSVNDQTNVTETQTHSTTVPFMTSTVYSDISNTYPVMVQATVTSPYVPPVSSFGTFPSIRTNPTVTFSPFGTPVSNIVPQSTSTSYPSMNYPAVSSQPGQFQDNLTTFSNYLMKKELMISRFTNFNDEPESFCAWKANFESVVRELNISDYEQIQLLVRWLGPESSKYADNIRQANASNPSEGLRMIWTRLDDRYGAAELIDSSLKTKLDKFPTLTLKDSKKLFELADILSQIDGVKKNPKYSAMFSYYDTSVGILPIVSKLPYSWREKWTSKASEYKTKNMVPYPRFEIFVEFIKELSRVRNDPGFQYVDEPKKKTEMKLIRVKKTDIEPTKMHQNFKEFKSNKCPLHNGQFHSLKSCRKFRTLSIEERKKIVKDNNLCFKCCGNHFAKHCDSNVKCDICSSERHHTALHPPQKVGGEETTLKTGGEKTTPKVETSVNSKCTIVCGSKFSGKSCAKTLLVNVYPSEHRNQSKRLYVILDDQSSQTLARPEFFDMFEVGGTPINYSLSSCSGTVSMTGRCGSNFVVEAIGNGHTINISRVIECEDIPCNKDEIPSPDVANAYPHLSDIAKEIPKIDDNADILLLIGRDHPDAHHVLSQITGPTGFPFAQKLPLGWAVIGECCLGKVHPPTKIIANKTHILPTGQATTLFPCPTHLHVLEPNHDYMFNLKEDDNQPGLSVEDREFLQIMDKDCFRDKEGYWTAPLPFRYTRPILPNNRDQAVKRMHSLISSFKRNPTKCDDAINFINRMLKNGHAEIAPSLSDGEECWYLPIFGVYHPRKPTQIRMVFDASASFFGKSLNSVLLQGPNLTNSLIGILLRFRSERVAVVGDVEQMFHTFKIREDHRNYVRFVWFDDNDPMKPLRDYRMCVHLFGNSPSPAVATYCLRKCVSGESCDKDIQDFVNKNFYVDDGLASFNTEQEALDLLLRTQAKLMEEGNVRFHKFASNSQLVVDALPPEDRAKDLVHITLQFSSVPTQRSLGINWNLQSDCFVFHFSPKDVPETKRGILSCLNGLYDPLGFLSPVILQGRFIFRDIVNLSLGWDDGIPQEMKSRWKTWCSSLHYLTDIKIPRTYVPTSLKESDRIELHVFADASEKAVSAVAYLRVIRDHNVFVGFVFGKSKLSPYHGHTVPRLELCAAVLAVEIARFVTIQLNLTIDKVTYYTDSRVVLGYIYNKTKRFHTYVSNRVHQIHLQSSPEQWHYVSSDQNPADIGTRSCIAIELLQGTWLTGPNFLHEKTESSVKNLTYPLQDPENDLEIRTETMKTEIAEKFSVERFEKFSSWKSVVRGLARLRRFIKQRQGLSAVDDAKMYRTTELILVKLFQKDKYMREIANLSCNKPVPKDSPLRYLDPYLDSEGIIRVGGRIRTDDALSGRHGPIVIPGKTHLSRLLVLHHHVKVKHQGRNLTEGALRSAGYWVIGSKRLVSSIIYSCVICRKLRRKLEHQKMANLPTCRILPTAPFTYVGVDTFGPWGVVTRKTRGGAANAKRWAILFTCMTSRAVHIELVEEMSSASFINALRRFVSLRGKVTEYYSVRGTNFVGCTDSLKINSLNVESQPVKKFLLDNASTWVFNPPHASHMGGVWERAIGTARRILDGIIVSESNRKLTHEVLSTFVCEVCAIMNSRPIVPVSVDPTQPSVLSPSILLTQKVDQDIGPFEELDIKDSYTSSWKHVQVLANQFWKRWQRDYLNTLQSRRKWIDSRDNIKKDDVVLLKEDTVRYDWPMGIVERVFTSNDGKVRKVELCIVRNGQKVLYVRPVTQIVHLFSP